MGLSKELYDFGLPDDRMNFFMQKVVQKFRSCTWIYGDEGFAYLTLQSTRDILGSVKYKERLQFLIDNNYVQKIAIGRHSISGNDIHAYIPLKTNYKKRKMKHKFMDNYYNNIEKSLSPIAKQILRNLRKTEIRISEEEFWECVGEPISDKQRESYETMFMEIEDFNSSSPKEINEYIVEDNFGKRVHTIISRLPKKIRSNYVYLNGERTVEIDLAQSQPTILGKVLESEIGANSFSYAVRNKDVYLELVNNIEGITRDDAKKIFYQIAFGKHKTKYTDMFFSLFPDTQDYISKIKSAIMKNNPSNKRHSNLAFMLQQRESNIFRQVWGRLRKERVLFLTVHDSLIIQEKNLTRYLPVITKELSKHIHSNINVTVAV
jgi:hypothetical protein